jgi:glycosyltransferase involved in cell wall biosynthesis
MNGRLLTELSPLDNVPVVTHAHELPRFVELDVSRDELDVVARRTSQWIVVSEAVRAGLPVMFGPPARDARLIRECIDPASIHARTEQDGSHKLLDVSSDELIIGGAGTVSARKGADLFGLLALAVMRRWRSEQPLAFRWVGGGLDSRDGRLVLTDLRAMGLARTVRFVGETRTPLACFAAMTVMVLLSREDPYPLVMLEAAALGRPLVCFDGSGGAPEFVRRGGGISVRYLDIEAMAEAVVHLLSNPDERRRLGGRARELALGHDAASTAREVGRVLDQAVAASQRKA